MPTIALNVASMIARRQAGFEARKADIESRNMDNYIEQCNKIDMYTEDVGTVICVWKPTSDHVNVD